ncbi:MAG: nuclear transport factor 2 family protein [Nitrospirales bacterium]
MNDRLQLTPVRKILWLSLSQAIFAVFVFGWALVWGEISSESGNAENPETVIRLIVKANAEMDLPLLEKYMAAGEDAVGYTIGGRKFVGWEQVKQAFQEEFSMLKGLTIDIVNLKVWQQGEVAWFAMEIDYNREVQTTDGPVKKTWPLRDTGVLTRQNGTWMLVNWHESMREPIQLLEAVPAPKGFSSSSASSGSPVIEVDLSGSWEIQEEDKAYQATLDAQGNGPYNWQEGRIQTEKLVNRLWSGTWHQKGNDREGAFEVLLAEDGTTAEGVWWYVRVGTQKNIPPREWGGSYKFKRLSAIPIP